MKNGHFSYVSALWKRYLAFAPILGVLLAMEFIWPLIGSGPMYSLASRDILDNCSQRWWQNLLFVNNINLKPFDACLAHTYWSAMDMQLFVLGIIGLGLIARFGRWGVAFCASMIAFDFGVIYYYATVNNLTPSIIARPISVP